jgi:YHS domain-containing protein
MVKDPVCGMYLDPHLAVKYSGKEGELYFCTEECRKKYLDGPAGPPGPGY